MRWLQLYKGILEEDIVGCKFVKMSLYLQRASFLQHERALGFWRMALGAFVKVLLEGLRVCKIVACEYWIKEYHASGSCVGLVPLLGFFVVLRGCGLL